MAGSNYNNTPEELLAFERQRKSVSDQHFHNQIMQSSETEKIRLQTEFNKMYKKRLEALEADAKGSKKKFWISTGLAGGALLFSIIGVLL